MTDDSDSQRGQRMLFDVCDALRAAENGRPIPPHVEKRWRADMRDRARAESRRRLHLELEITDSNAFREDS